MWQWKDWCQTGKFALCAQNLASTASCAVWHLATQTNSGHRSDHTCYMKIGCSHDATRQKVGRPESSNSNSFKSKDNTVLKQLPHIAMFLINSVCQHLDVDHVQRLRTKSYLLTLHPLWLVPYLVCEKMVFTVVVGICLSRKTIESTAWFSLF